MVKGRRFRTFNIIDDFTREALETEIKRSLSAKRIIRTVDNVILDRGKPNVILTDNGPEFTSKDLETWSKNKDIQV